MILTENSEPPVYRCPVCGGPVTRTTDYMDHVLMESSEWCAKCGYRYEYLTGSSLEVIDGVEVYGSWADSVEEMGVSSKRRDELIKQARKKYVLL